jgi:cell shape-determining protein MreC
MYVCTEKAAIQEWLKEIEELKAENKRFEELLTKS